MTPPPSDPTPQTAQPASASAAPSIATSLHLPTLITLVGGKLLLHLLTFSGYGFFRDELYYLACSRHLAWGYVDHPPLSIALLTVMRSLFGDALWVVRLLPALAGAAVVAMVGLLCARLGGGRWAQLMAMVGALIAPIYLGTTHIFSMNIFDVLLWSLVAWQLTTILDQPFDAPRQPRRWLLLGLLLGLGLLNKISVLWLGVGLAVGLLATPARRWLITPWPWLAGVTSMLCFLPHLIWQHLYGWPTLEFVANATGQKMVSKSVGEFWGEQILTMHPLNVVLWLGGLGCLLFRPSLRRFRLLPWIFLTVATILILNGTSRASYLAPAYTWLLAAGGVGLESWLRSIHWRRGILVMWLVSGAALLPLAVPVLPVDTYIAYSRALGVEPSTSEKKELSALPQFYADMHGWPQIVDAVAEVYFRLSPEEQAFTAIVATNYGVAGAIDHFGRDLGLPNAWSQHNNYFFWGPMDAEDPPPAVVLHLGGPQEALQEIFEQVTLGGVTECEHCMPYENHRPIFVCRGLRPGLGTTWADGKHFD